MEFKVSDDDRVIRWTREIDLYLNRTCRYCPESLRRFVPRLTPMGGARTRREPFFQTGRDVRIDVTVRETAKPLYHRRMDSKPVTCQSRILNQLARRQVRRRA